MMDRLPERMEDTTGAVYVATHAREFDRERWISAAVSCLLGEQGQQARELVRLIARRMGFILGETEQ